MARMLMVWVVVGPPKNTGDDLTLHVVVVCYCNTLVVALASLCVSPVAQHLRAQRAGRGVCRGDMVGHKVCCCTTPVGFRWC
jgi:hypothetical protein